MKEKVFEVSKGSDKMITMTYSQVSELLLSSNFMTMLNRLKIGEEMFNHDKMLNFKRIE